VVNLNLSISFNFASFITCTVSVFEVGILPLKSDVIVLMTMRKSKRMTKATSKRFLLTVPYCKTTKQEREEETREGQPNTVRGFHGTLK
jgi:hypothetical protein